jgi:hypothetical protein
MCGALGGALLPLGLFIGGKTPARRRAAVQKASGARFFFPEAMTVLDIGGQDSKAIAMNAAGKVATFEMNDRCAAGTGKFLEIMARSLDFSPAQFGSEALQAEKGIQINSMCWVFAESEATSLVARGEDQRSKTSKCQTQGYVVWRPRSLKFSPPVGNAWICRCNCPPLANCGELHIYAADERPRPLTGTQDKERGHE